MPAQPDLAGSGHVWYAAYGSNLDRERFLCYIGGGRPLGAARTYPGCRDTSEPLAEASSGIPHPLYFAGASSVWGGAVAFVETTPSKSPQTLVRLYLITWEQFTDVYAQDNWYGEAGADLPPLATLRRDRVVRVGSGWYDTVVFLGERRGAAILTFTAGKRGSVGEPAPPPHAYVETMARGLAASHGLAPEEFADYVMSARGAAGNLDRQVLVELLSRSR